MQNPMQLPYCSIITDLNDKLSLKMDAGEYLRRNQILKSKVYAYPPRSYLRACMNEFMKIVLADNGQIWLVIELDQTIWVRQKLQARFEIKFFKLARPRDRKILGKTLENGLALLGLLKNKK